MKAVTYARYGPPEVLAIEEVATLVPAKDEVQIKVRAVKDELLDLKDMIESGRIVSSVDRVQPMEQAAAALRLIETEQ